MVASVFLYSTEQSHSDEKKVKQLKEEIRKTRFMEEQVEEGNVPSLHYP